ncbi:hypothetical protein MCUN1_000343 [Malassezia cuniculi]|uniref:RNA helicase n=1 Tax=Malassezia cuniculi TaxID=948313 RepID=A0AAF0ER56_9BASI|nr:hypothetical protein MCUN1_000343 [Malassezia cuniculi]
MFNRLCTRRVASVFAGRAVPVRVHARVATACVRPYVSHTSPQATEDAVSTHAAAPPSPGGGRHAFARLGIPQNLCTQLSRTLPYIKEPTHAQAELIPAILAPNDVILRAHTGSGKSFAVLLALLAKPRIIFRSGNAGVSALVVVPSNELAAQYLDWARTLIPASVVDSLDTVVQVVVRGEPLDEQAARLRGKPPHIVIGTPTRLLELLALDDGSKILGIGTLRTLVYDETDALLQLPGRFPTMRERWRHDVHRAPGLDLLNRIMQVRPTFSGGDAYAPAGLERGNRKGDEARPPEHVRRVQYKGAEKSRLAPALPRSPKSPPLQLVCTSATANSVLRHFLGARTGWLRVMLRETRMTSKWLDMTGLSAGRNAGILPKEITHSCLVVDEKAPGVPEVRNMCTASGTPTHGPPEHQVDVALLEGLAYAFALQGVRRGLALIPARWSLARTIDALRELGVPACAVGAPSSEPVLFVLQDTSARGLDMVLDHVFIVGAAAVRDAVHYTHLAGRVSRIGPHSSGADRPAGHVVTLVRGVGPDAVGKASSAEIKMARIYDRLGVAPQPIQLQ